MRKCGRIIYIGIMGMVTLLNVAAWNSRAFCDWYILHVYPVWVNIYGRITSLFPFSVGEFMLFVGMLLVAAAVILGIIWLFGMKVSGRRRFSHLCGVYYRVFAWILLGVCVLMTLNWRILYHASPFSEKYFGDVVSNNTPEELTALRNFVVEQCNALSCQIPRREDGTIFYDGDMCETAKAAMRQLGEVYENLDGYYPTLKPLVCSDFMSRQYVAGCYFPFSMEANYNDVMYVMNMPSTFCHELGHLKGYIYEDEANFIGYLACVRSEDIYFRYSGYLSVLYYVDNDFFDTVGYDRYCEEPRILPQVYEDNVFLTEEEWARIEKNSLLDTEIVDALSDSFTDNSLKLNGIPDGMASYSRVVKLLLQYYGTYGYEADG